MSWRHRQSGKEVPPEIARAVVSALDAAADKVPELLAASDERVNRLQGDMEIAFERALAPGKDHTGGKNRPK